MCLNLLLFKMLPVAESPPLKRQQDKEPTEIQHRNSSSENARSKQNRESFTYLRAGPRGAGIMGRPHRNKGAGHKSFPFPSLPQHKD